MLAGKRLWALRIIPCIMLNAAVAVQPQAWGDDECGFPHAEGVNLIWTVISKLTSISHSPQRSASGS